MMNERYIDNQRTLRRRHNLTQERFGELIGINRSTVGAIEEGRQSPSIELLLKVADQFGLTPYELWYNDIDDGKPNRGGKPSRMYTGKEIQDAVVPIIGKGSAWTLIKSRLNLS